MLLCPSPQKNHKQNILREKICFTHSTRVYCSKLYVGQSVAEEIPNGSQKGEEGEREIRKMGISLSIYMWSERGGTERREIRS